MRAMTTVLKEQFKNFYLIGRLSAYETKKEYADSQLGIVWVFLNPLLQIAVYWFVFGTGIRGNHSAVGTGADKVPFLTWMLCGLIPWFYISAAILQGSNSIYARLGTVSKMNFPLSIIPTYVVMSRFYTHVFLMIVLLIEVILTRGISHISFWGLAYFAIANTILLIALSFLTSTLSTMLRDIHLLIQSITRMMLYLTPILWTPNPHSKSILVKMMKINPFYYIVEGYRKVLLYNDPAYILSKYSLYFWGVVIVLFIIGAAAHVKFRRQFVDYL
jgi:teichoic acid transport system permease protein